MISWIEVFLRMLFVRRIHLFRMQYGDYKRSGLAQKLLYFFSNRSSVNCFYNMFGYGFSNYQFFFEGDVNF